MEGQSKERALLEAVEAHRRADIDRLVAEGVWSLQAYNLAYLRNEFEIARCLKRNHPDAWQHPSGRAWTRRAVHGEGSSIPTHIASPNNNRV